MSDMTYSAQIVSSLHCLREPILRSAIETLQLSLGSQGLDVGCGMGFQAQLLADAIGVNGHVIGLDISPDLLSYAEQMLEKTNFSERISFQQGDIRQLPFDSNSFDWAWSVDCVGYIPIEPLPLMKELVRVVKSGGHIAILAWTSEKLLPGYPILEAHLNSTSAGIAPFISGQKAESHFMRALGWFHQVGVKNVAVTTLARDVFAPLTDELRSTLIELLQMRWSGAEAELSHVDRSEFRRLCQAESSDFILDQPDYSAFFTYTMFYGKVLK